MTKIYISSTYSDLKDHRERAHKQLRKSRYDVITMEDYTARSGKPVDECLSDVREADIYVGLFAWRYGFVPPQDNPEGRSITEMEYREAVAHKKQILIFLLDEGNDVAWPLSYLDSHTGDGDAGARIKALREELKLDYMSAFFTTPNSLAAELTPAVQRAWSKLNPPKAGQVDQIDTLPLPELQKLAARFEVDDALDQSAEYLRDLLGKKADEYHALRAEVEGIDDGLKRLSNLKAAAQDAIARVDLEEVEDLLSRVQEVELEEAAKTAELRANNALLRGRVDQAYRLLMAAADSFAAVDALEPARRKNVQARALYFHGMRYGGSGIARYTDALRNAISSIRKGNHPDLWGSLQNSLAIASSEQGIRTAGPEGTDLLSKAVSAYRSALTVRTFEDHPVDWAAIQNNLGVALFNQGIRTAGPEGTDLLSKAVSAYRSALTVRTFGDHPVDWAATQNNLGAALQEQGTRTAGPKGADLLAASVTAYRSALTIRTIEDHPVDWAMTQNNLGNALSDQGTRTAGPEGANLLAEAVTAYRSALTVRTFEDHPVHWAETQENIAHAEQARADHDTCADPRPHLEAALAAVENALTVYDPEHMSYRHDQATTLRDNIRAELDALPPG